MISCHDNIFLTKLSFNPLAGALAISADIFSEGVSPRLLTAMNCIGNESNILDCDKSVFNGVNCPTAAVICQGKMAGFEKQY